MPNGKQGTLLGSFLKSTLTDDELYPVTLLTVGCSGGPSTVGPKAGRQSLEVPMQWEPSRGQSAQIC